MSGFEAPALSFPGSETAFQLSGLLIASGLGVVAATLVPLTAWVLRRRLPRDRRAALRRLEPVTFGNSQKARRSPRHAILLHRGLMSSFFMALVALFLVPAAASLTKLGAAAIPTALAFVLPTLLVTIHARRQSARE